MSTAEMRILWWINGVTREDRVKIEHVRDSTGVA